MPGPSRPILFQPTGAPGKRATVLEIQVWGHDEPYFLPVEGDVVDCPEPCDWPALTCMGWEIEERPFPQPPLLEAVAHASPEGLECSWLAYAPSYQQPTQLWNTDGCRSAEGAPPLKADRTTDRPL